MADLLAGVLEAHEQRLGGLASGFPECVEEGKNCWSGGAGRLGGGFGSLDPLELLGDVVLEVLAEQVERRPDRFSRRRWGVRVGSAVLLPALRHRTMLVEVGGDEVDRLV